MPVHSVFLKYFDAVCHSGSIRLAARKLYVASSAVNRQILKIENELGVKLFERSASGIRLTAAGELMAQHISRTLVDAEQTMRRIAALKDGQQQVVRIVGQESIIAQFLPPALLELHAEYPEIATVFKAANGTQLQELLRADDADIAAAFDPEASDDIEIIATETLTVGAVLTPCHPLADRTQVSLTDCVPFPILLPDQSWPLRAQLDREIEQSGLILNIITSSNSVEFLKTMVSQQLGIGFQTIVGIEALVEKGELAHVPLVTTAPVSQTFALCVRAQSMMTPVLERVLALLKKRLLDYQDSAAKVRLT